MLTGCIERVCSSGWAEVACAGLGTAAGTGGAPSGGSGAGRAKRATWLPVSSPNTPPCTSGKAHDAKQEEGGRLGDTELSWQQCTSWKPAV